MVKKTSRESLISMMGGFRLTQCIYVVAKLQVSDALADGPLEITKLAEIVKVNAGALIRILRYLCSYGIFDEVTDEVFAGNELSDFLRLDHEYSLRPMAILSGEEFYEATAPLLYSVTTGKPGFDKVFKQNFWHYLLEHKDASQSFNDAMERGSYSLISQLLDYYDFSDIKTIVDIGGGKGHIAAEILSRHPGIDAIVFDLPQVQADCNSYIESRYLNQRCKFAGGDFFTHTKLPQADAYILKTILHDWADPEAGAILKLCALSMGKSNKLLIIDRVINQGEDINQNAYMWDIQMLAIHGGKERSIQDFNKLLEDAQLKLTNIIRINSELYLLEAMSK